MISSKKIIIGSLSLTLLSVAVLFTNATSKPSKKVTNFSALKGESKRLGKTINSPDTSEGVRRVLAGFKHGVTQRLAAQGKAKSCAELYALDPYARSGVYTLFPVGSEKGKLAACQFKSPNAGRYVASIHSARGSRSYAPRGHKSKDLSQQGSSAYSPSKSKPLSPQQRQSSGGRNN